MPANAPGAARDNTLLQKCSGQLLKRYKQPKIAIDRKTASGYPFAKGTVYI